MSPTDHTLLACGRGRPSICWEVFLRNFHVFVVLVEGDGEEAEEEVWGGDRVGRVRVAAVEVGNSVCRVCRSILFRNFLYLNR